MLVLPTVASNGLGQTIRLRAATVSFRALGLASCTFALLPNHYELYQILPLRPCVVCHLLHCPRAIRYKRSYDCQDVEEWQLSH
jgi:hypothetical protein